jgi:hypothetical protein
MSGSLGGIDLYCKLIAIIVDSKNALCFFAKKMSIMNRSKFPFTSSFLAGLAFFLVLVLVASVPFGHALEIHHIFSTIDHDGHEHSDFDLCQWVQQHTSHSLVWSLPSLAQRFWVYSLLPVANDQIFFPLLSSLLHSRGPPTSLFF